MAVSVLKRSPSRSKHFCRTLALDTEDDSKGNVKLINFFDGTSHYTFRERLPAWNWLRNNDHAIVWACNMEYDIGNLFGDWIDEILTLTYNNSAFIKAQWSGHALTFRDTLRHWPMSVKAMGDYLKLEKMTPGGTVNKFDDVEYCRRDTEIVFRFVEEMTKRYAILGADVKNTLPSSAFNLFKQDYCEIDLKRPSDAICDQLMKAAYGGRVEIFRTGLLQGPIDCYDINSLYPSVMASNEYPLPSSGRMSEKFDESGDSITEAELTVPEMDIPPLPFRGNNKLIFPVGKLRGVWTAPEIRQAITDGAKIEKIHWSYKYTEKCRPFGGWVGDMYGRRQVETDELMRYTLKIFMNSVFGKFTEAGALQIYRKRKRTDLENRPDHSNVCLGAYTTAYGRLRLLKALRENSKNLCYCDTDSIFVQNSDKIPTGPGLGEWKHEGTFSTAEFILPKFYMTVAANGKKSYKTKGIPKKSAEEFIQRGIAEYQTPIRFRESKRRSIQLNEWVTKTRKLKASYEKRVVLAGGKTEPLKIGG